MIEFMQGDSRHLPFPNGYFQCVVTSPSYYGLRDYQTGHWEGGDPNCEHKPGSLSRVGDKSTLGGSPRLTQGHQQEGYGKVCPKCGAIRIDAQIGLEQTPELYVANMVQVFREIWRVLRDDGTVWLNLGDSYAGSGKGQGGKGTTSKKQLTNAGSYHGNIVVDCGLKSKQLLGIPWRVAFALQDDGWYLRNDIIWHKLNSLPESVRDRVTKSHEYVFLLTKKSRYYYDCDAIREPYSDAWMSRAYRGTSESNKWNNDSPGSASAVLSKPRENATKLKDRQETAFGGDGHSGYMSADGTLLINPLGRNKRSVWSIATQNFHGAHFAVMPEKLVEPCILAGTSEKGACPQCGAPWERVVDYKANYEKRENSNSYNGSPTKVDSLGWNPPTMVNKGWRPTCNCGIEETVPCKVLDPFAGSGTVGVVCARYGRDFFGVDLNPEYVEIARKRANGTQRKISLPLTR